MDTTSYKISTISPAGTKPDNLLKSTAASVCPALLNTTCLCFKGKICPGLPNSLGFVSGLINA